MGLGLNFMSLEETPHALDGSAAAKAGVGELLAEADACWRRGGREGVAAAVALCDEALGRLVEACEADRARVWLRRGQILESGRSEGDLREAVRSHDAGLAELARAVARDAGRDEAGGVAGERERGRLRALLWMNRGNALLASGSPEQAREAARSYDEALAIANRGMAAEMRGESAAMMGAAWLNRAAASALGWPDETGRHEQGRCLRRAIEALFLAAEAGQAAARRNLAGAWFNLAAWHEARGEMTAARAAWREAARTAAPEADRDFVALETGLRASHALCVAQARRIVGGEELDEAERRELFARVEEGLAACASWTDAGRPAASVNPEATASRLFEFGAWWWHRAAPEALAGFLRRWGDGAGAERLETARVAAEVARQEILQGGFETLAGEGGESRRVRLRELSALVEHFSNRQQACRQARTSSAFG